MVTAAKTRHRVKKLPEYHDFPHNGDHWDTPELECPECHADISYGVCQLVTVKRGKRVPHCRKCAGILNGEREDNGKLKSINKLPTELVVR